MDFDVKPKFVSFDMNGTLIHFRINDAIRGVLGDRLPIEIADEFLQGRRCLPDRRVHGRVEAVPSNRRSVLGTNHAQVRPGIP